jgi:RNA polymerase sigma-70 factor, ECF subfamily
MPRSYNETRAETRDPPTTFAVTPLDVQRAIEEHLPRIHRAALVLTGNPWDADDLAQETFLVLARQSASFGGRSTLYTWLYGILLNLERRERRRRGIGRRKLQALHAERSVDGRVSPAADAAAESAEWKSSLWSFVARLPEGQRHVLVLRFSEHLPYSEIATVLECPLGTVKSRIFHGLESLRELLEAEGGETRIAPMHAREDCQHAI